MPTQSTDAGACEARSGQERKDLPPAALRALAESAERRAAMQEKVAAMPPERGGRAGPEPVRYGDWEVKGLASDF